MKHEIFENRSINCYIPTTGYWFVKCINFITGEGYKQHYPDFIRNHEKRSNIKTKARVQAFCGTNNIIIGYFGGRRVFPRTITDRNNAFFLHNNHFCLIWMSENVSFNQAIREVRENFKKVYNYSKGECSISFYVQIHTKEN